MMTKENYVYEGDRCEEMENFSVLPGWYEGDSCPVHGNKHKKMYTFGSSYSAETDVCVFHSCRCAVAVKHDPVGTYPSEAVYCLDYNTASGIGKLRAMDAAAKYR